MVWVAFDKFISPDERERNFAGGAVFVRSGALDDPPRAMIDEHKCIQRQSRAQPRTSAAVSSITRPPAYQCPGVDRNDSAALQEIEDLEYVKRFNDGLGDVNVLI